VQIKPRDADRFLAKPSPDVRVVLLFGSDSGLVSERAAAFARTVIGDGDAALNQVRLDSADIAADPGRLADEANALAMFGGDRAIIVTVEGNRPIHKSVQALLDAPPRDAWVVLSAGELRRGAGLRALCEKHPGAAAIACYADDEQALGRLIDEELATAGLTIAADARELLTSLLGGDRRISRSEIGKLRLYVGDRTAVTLDDVRAVIGDAAAFAIDQAVDAMALGEVDELDRTYRRLIASGTPGVVIAGAALRHFNYLHRARAARDAGQSLDTVVERARPPIFYTRQAGVKRQLRLWSRRRIETCLEILDEAVLDSRLNGPIADPVIARALTRIAIATGGTGRR